MTIWFSTWSYSARFVNWNLTDIGLTPSFNSSIEGTSFTNRIAPSRPENPSEWCTLFTTPGLKACSSGNSSLSYRLYSNLPRWHCSPFHRLFRISHIILSCSSLLSRHIRQVWKEHYLGCLTESISNKLLGEEDFQWRYSWRRGWRCSPHSRSSLWSLVLLLEKEERQR